MAKKAKKKVTKKVTKKVAEATPPTPDIVDSRVEGLQNLANNIDNYDLGSMNDRFDKSLVGLRDSILAVAKRLTKAIEVEEKKRAQKLALRQKLLDRAANIDV